MSNSPPSHGTRARYEWHVERCRCEQCRHANATYQRTYRRHGTGYYRRISRSVTDE